jgi:hypothetical protein
MLGALLAFALRLSPNAPSLDLFGPGPFTNLSTGDEQAFTNAAAHVWFGATCPLAGYYIGGQKGLRVAGLSCAALIITRETFFHGHTAGPEVRTDLISGLAPIAVILAMDAIIHR